MEAKDGTVGRAHFPQTTPGTAASTNINIYSLKVGIFVADLNIVVCVCIRIFRIFERLYK